MPEKIEQVLSGALGYYWEQHGKLSIDEPAKKGYLRLLEDTKIQVELLHEFDLFDALKSWPDGSSLGQSKPDAMIGVTQHGGVLLLDSAGYGYTRVIGGPQASIERFGFGALVASVNVDELKSTKLTSLSVLLPGVLQWMGASAVSEELEVDSRKKVKGATLKVRQDEDFIVSLGASKVIAVRARWTLTGPDDARTVRTFLGIDCRASRPARLSELVHPILCVQDLLSLAYGEPISIESASVSLDYSSERNSHSPIWASRLNDGKDNSVGKLKPLFLLSDLGGERSIAAWIQFYKKYPRFIAPVARHWRLGKRAVESELLEIATAIEYYVAAVKKDRRIKWVAKKPPVKALALHAGPVFAHWVQDVDKWSVLFWDTYNHIKHNPSDCDPSLIYRMVQSGRVLVIATILIRVSGSKDAVARMLADRRYSRMGEEVRSLVEESSLIDESRRSRRRRKRGS